MHANHSVIDQCSPTASRPTPEQLPVEGLQGLRSPPHEHRQRDVTYGRPNVVSNEAVVCRLGVLIDVVLWQPAIQQVTEGCIRPGGPERVCFDEQLRSELLRFSQIWRRAMQRQTLARYGIRTGRHPNLVARMVLAHASTTPRASLLRLLRSSHG
jgi:hypothetical protein